MERKERGFGVENKGWLSHACICQCGFLTKNKKGRNKTRMFTLPTFIQYSIRIPSQNNKTGERNKRYSNMEGRSQISLFDPRP
jgi:hypothetical protein